MIEPEPLHIELTRLAVDQLLAIRLVLDESGPWSNIEQDVQDLREFPERLLTSYRDEWIAYNKPRLRWAYLLQRFGHEAVDVISMRLEDCILTPEDINAELINLVRNTERMLSTEGVAIIESGPSRRISKLIGPRSERGTSVKVNHEDR